MTPTGRVLIIAYDSYKRTYLCTEVQSRTTYLVQLLRLCQHAYSQRVAWLHALGGDKPSRQAHKLEETLCTSTQHETRLKNAVFCENDT